MAPADLARLAAEAIVDRVAEQPAPGEPGYRPPVEIAEELISGAIARALDEHGRAYQEVMHLHQPSLGGVDVKVTKSTQGVSLEVDVKRGREPDESYDEASGQSARLAALSYERAEKALAQIGLVPGKDRPT